MSERNHPQLLSRKGIGILIATSALLWGCESVSTQAQSAPSTTDFFSAGWNLQVQLNGPTSIQSTDKLVKAEIFHESNGDFKWGAITPEVPSTDKDDSGCQGGEKDAACEMKFRAKGKELAIMCINRLRDGNIWQAWCKLVVGWQRLESR